jgi:DNA replication protein DnaD
MDKEGILSSWSERREKTVAKVKPAAHQTRITKKKKCSTRCKAGEEDMLVSLTVKHLTKAATN